jgi:hypothetical protein
VIERQEQKSEQTQKDLKPVVSQIKIQAKNMRNVV